MSFFQQVEGAGCILTRGGISYQVPIYTRDGIVYAKWQAGFVRLMADGSTSAPSAKLRLDYINTDLTLGSTPLGSLCTEEHPACQALTGPKLQRLLEGTKA